MMHTYERSIQHRVPAIYARESVITITFVVLLMTACGGQSQLSSSRTAELPVADESSAEYQLAVIQSQSAPPPPGMVSDFDMTLGYLERKCKQSRSSSPSLGDIAVNGVRLLVEAGKPMTLLELLRAIDRSIPENGDMKLDCAEAGARLLMTMGVKAPEGSR
jgi:hypothetical protein